MKFQYFQGGNKQKKKKKTSFFFISFIESLARFPGTSMAARCSISPTSGAAGGELQRVFRCLDGIRTLAESGRYKVPY